MEIDISQSFEAVTIEKYRDETLRALKLDNVSQLEEKLNFISCEGVELTLEYSSKVEPLFLNSFPGERKLFKFTEKLNENDFNLGVDAIISSTDLKHKKAFNLVREKRELHDHSYLDIYSLYLEFGKDVDRLKSFIESQKRNLFTSYIASSMIHNAGGSIVQELTFILSLLKFNADALNNVAPIIIEMSVDSLFFNNIAKLRAIRFMVESLQEQCSLGEVKILARPSLREQSFYDPWTNMLRNTTSMSASFLGGADYIATNSFDHIASVHSKHQDSELGLRQSRNSFHVLNEESFLSSVEDPSLGSYAIEKLTRQYIEMSFDKFKQMENSGGALNSLNKLSLEVEMISKKRYETLSSMKSTMVGVNGFANTDENSQSLYQKKSLLTQEKGLFPLRRVSFEFEQLRHSLEEEQLKIVIVAYGPESKISARIMFCQNYFEVLGPKCEVIWLSDKEEDLSQDLSQYNAVVLCSVDELYPKMLKHLKLPKEKVVFTAGKKFRHEKFQNIFLGQNQLDILARNFSKENK